MKKSATNLLWTILIQYAIIIPILWVANHFDAYGFLSYFGMGFIILEIGILFMIDRMNWFTEPSKREFLSNFVFLSFFPFINTLSEVHGLLPLLWKFSLGWIMNLVIILAAIFKNYVNDHSKKPEKKENTALSTEENNDTEKIIELFDKIPDTEKTILISRIQDKYRLLDL